MQGFPSTSYPQNSNTYDYTQAQYAGYLAGPMPGLQPGLVFSPYTFQTGMPGVGQSLAGLTAVMNPEQLALDRETAALSERLEQLSFAQGQGGYGAQGRVGSSYAVRQGPAQVPGSFYYGHRQPVVPQVQGRGRGAYIPVQGGRGQQPQQPQAQPQQAKKQKKPQKGLEEHVKRTVYISYVDNQVTEEALATFFQDCGRVVDCRICGDPNSALRFAFIEFADLDSAQRALSKTGAILGSSPLRVLPSKTAIVPVNREYMPRSGDDIERCSRTVYVTNIDKKVDKNDVRNFFEQLCGKVTKIRLLGDYAHSTRIAFVEFQQAESALAALNCSGALLGSLPIRVSPSKTPVRDNKELQHGPPGTAQQTNLMGSSVQQQQLLQPAKSDPDDDESAAQMLRAQEEEETAAEEAASSAQ